MFIYIYICVSWVYSPIHEKSSRTGPTGLKILMHWRWKYLNIHLLTLPSEDINTNWNTTGSKQDVRGYKRIQEEQRVLYNDKNNHEYKY